MTQSMMKHHSLLLPLVVATLLGCAGSKPSAPVASLEPAWLKTATEKTQAFYAYLNLPMPDSLKRKTIVVALKGGVQESIEIGEVMELAFYAKKLATKDAEVFADALSASLQAIQAARFSPAQADLADRLKADYATLALSFARRADSLALAVHDQINAVDADYRRRLSASMESVAFFAGAYEKIKRLLGIELELAQLALDEYQRASEHLKLAGLNDEAARLARNAFLSKLRGLMSDRLAGLQTAQAQFVKKNNEDASNPRYRDAENHYGTLIRLASETLSKLKERQ